MENYPELDEITPDIYCPQILQYINNNYKQDENFNNQNMQFKILKKIKS